MSQKQISQILEKILIEESPVSSLAELDAAVEALKKLDVGGEPTVRILKSIKHQFSNCNHLYREFCVRYTTDKLTDSQFQIFRKIGSSLDEFGAKASAYKDNFELNMIYH